MRISSMRLLAGLHNRIVLAEQSFVRRRWSCAAMAANAAGGAGPVDPRADRLLRFWFGEDYLRAPANDTAAAKAKSWFGGGAAFDAECKQFEPDVEAAADGRLAAWSSGLDGLAAVILMDQITRNIYRGSAQSFSLDGQALQLSKQIHVRTLLQQTPTPHPATSYECAADRWLQDGGSLSGVPAIQRTFLYMPLMHSEQLADLELCVRRFQELRDEAKQLPDSDALCQALENNINYAVAHKRVIEAWNRYPHRNKLLGRPNTPEEEAAFAAGQIPSF